MDTPVLPTEVIQPTDLSQLSDRELLELIVQKLDDMVTAFVTVSNLVTSITEDMAQNGGGIGGLLKTLMAYR